MLNKKKCVLTIAGSDSGAGAGIQSDLKTFQNYGVYGLTVLTAVTAQNTLGVQKSFGLPAGIVEAQLKSVLSDFDIKVVKTGMLSSAKIIDVIVKNLKNKNAKIVVDPVILSKNNYPLLDKSGISALKHKLLPLTYIVTPNLFEAEVLAGFKITSGDKLVLAAKKIYGFGCKYVLVKGGHFPYWLNLEKGSDILYDGKKHFIIKSAFVKSRNTHGIGCTLSAAIASNIAKGMQIQNAIINAKLYIVKSLRKSVKIGKGVSAVEQ
jgi:hydroxymethylpyrimidine/phosphomethylpyrimidine kinase